MPPTPTKAILNLMLIFLFLTISISAQSPSSQTSSQPQSQQPFYTQNIQQFKSKKYNQRLEVVVGCWLLSKQYLDLYKSNYLFFKDQKMKEVVVLKLVKECMKRISRKDAVLKITELVGKNLEQPKKYEDLVMKQVVDDIFIEVSKLAVANYHEYEPINNEGIVNENTEELNNAETDSHSQKTNVTQQSSDTQQNQAKQQQDLQALNEQSQSSFKNLSEFDTYLIQLIQKYNHQFHKLISSKQGLRGKVEEELKKREKYYFGFIPASSFSHSVFLVTISLSMVFCCTCYKYYKMRSNEKTENRKKLAQEGEENEHSYSHSKIRESRKIAKMTQLTMKKKTR